MVRKPITKIIIEVKRILEKEKELSIRQLSIKTKCQWRTVEKALETLAILGVVKEKRNEKGERDERLFSLVRK